MAEQDASAAEIGRRAAEAAIGTARQGARRLGEEMREAGASIMVEQKGRLVDAVHGLADALHRASHTLQQEQSPVASRVAEQAASQLERVADGLRERQLGDLVSRAEDLARRQPALFLAAAVATGFIAARLLAPSSPAPRHRPATEPEGEQVWREGPHPADEPVAGAGRGR